MENWLTYVAWQFFTKQTKAYIPHREVVREDRVTTKTRIVFDASTRRKGPSLNEFLEAGPCLLPKVFDVLLRCRAHKILLISDIQSAFLNIHTAEKDRDFHRFLWIQGRIQTSDLTSAKLCYKMLRLISFLDIHTLRSLIDALSPKIFHPEHS